MVEVSLFVEARCLPETLLICTRLARKRGRVAWHFGQDLRATHCDKLENPKVHLPAYRSRLRGAVGGRLAFGLGRGPGDGVWLGGHPPCRVAQACVNSAPKNRIRAE